MTALGLTPKQREALDFIETSIARGVSPSYVEIQNAIGIKSKSCITRIVTALKERGHIIHLPRRSRSIALANDRNQALDAARYRYLRNRPANAIGNGGVFAGMTPPTGSGGYILTEDDLDRAIDEAMARERMQ